MLIDWFTIGAQVLNFLILVWLLKRFLYHPILQAIDAREQRIAAELADAAAKQVAADGERQSFADKNAAFEQQRAGLLSKATEAANAERQRLLDEARMAATVLGERREAAMLAEAKSLQHALGERARDEIFAIARKALTDLAGTSLEARMVEVFVVRLQSMSDAEREAMHSQLQVAGQPLIVRSSLELPAAERASLEAAVRAIFGADAAITFQLSPDLVSGIELSSDGHKVAWSIAEYLRALEKGLGEVIKAGASAPHKITPAAGEDHAH